MFSEAGPQLDIFTYGVIGLVDNAVPGLERAVLRSTPVVKGLADGMVTAGTRVTRFFTAITRDSEPAATSLRAFGTIISDAGELIGTMAFEVTSVFAGVSDETTDVFSSINSGTDLSASLFFDARNIDSASIAVSVAPDDLTSDVSVTGTAATAGGDNSTLYSAWANTTLRSVFGRSWNSASFDGVDQDGRKRFRIEFV